MTELDQYLTLAQKVGAKYALASSQTDSELKNVAKAKLDHTTALEAQGVLQAVAQKVQQHAHDKIASVVTRCLEAVYGEESYKFVIDFRRQRGKTEAVLQFIKDDLLLEDPVNEVGGGVLDVAAFALRVACLILCRPALRRTLWLDEPFRHLSKDLRPAARDLITTLAKEMRIQFVIVTHDPALRIGKVIEIGEENELADR